VIAVDCEAHPGSAVIRKGERARKDGTVVVRYLCEQAGGHSLSAVDPSTVPARTRRRTKTTQRMVCADARHQDATITKDGARTGAAGTWQRYRCTRPDGSCHWFQTLTSPSGSVLASNTPAPSCPEHLGSKVTRDGKHKHSKAKADLVSTRQRYLCRPADGSPQHRFVPSMPREVVAK
jgi:hypothetical protein